MRFRIVTQVIEIAIVVSESVDAVDSRRGVAELLQQVARLLAEDLRRVRDVHLLDAAEPCGQQIKGQQSSKGHTEQGDSSLKLQSRGLSGSRHYFRGGSFSGGQRGSQGIATRQRRGNRQSGRRPVFGIRFEAVE